MNEEISLFGIFVPSVLACSVISYVVMVAVSRVLRVVGAYQYIWHRSLFNLSMFVCILCATVLFLFQAQS
ncbi:DUF1656 domain-containing protein [Hyphomicrobium sp. MC8b]|uniref:DUF1656 domain-containing protein n=1 Tax=Hyphomicrobium sp. MC8b TaxID=300273 RepID=UPI00391D986B